MAKQFIAQVWGGLTVFVWTSLLSAVIWGAFAISECTRAQEVKYLEEAVSTLCQMVAVDPASSMMTTREPTPEIKERWQRVVRFSPLVSRIAKEHGWCQGSFAGGTPTDLWTLRQDLLKARGEKAETALEIADAGCLPALASFLHACPVTRHLALLRLRIAPAAEISGLGAASTDGGQLLQTIQSTLFLLREARHDQQRFHSPMRREIRQLSMTVRSQEVLLEALMRSNRRNRARWGGPRRSLGSVAEQPEGSSDSEQPVDLEAAQGCSAASAVARERTGEGLGPSVSEDASEDVSSYDPQPVPVEAVTDGLGRLLPRSYSHSSDRTLSDRSAGNLTPRSMASDTPSPSVIGRAMRPQTRSSRGQAVTTPNALATQLAGVLQTHQQLLTALQQVAAAPSSGRATPDSQGSSGRGLHFQQALQSLSRQLEQQPGQGMSPLVGGAAAAPSRGQAPGIGQVVFGNPVL